METVEDGLILLAAGCLCCTVRGDLIATLEDLLRKRDNGRITLEVVDDGPGIESEYHERIFIIFQTLHERDTIESTGVGLAIVKKIIERQGGNIRLESAPGKGSNFIFTWPKEPEKIAVAPKKDSIPEKQLQ